MKAVLLNIVRELTPPIALRLLKYVAGRHQPAAPSYRQCGYQGVKTAHNAAPIHFGRFSEIRDRYVSQNPFTHSETTRLRHYYVNYFASMACTVPGDFAFFGISFGVAARVVFDFVNFTSLGKRMYLVDPFDGSLNRTDGTNRLHYNNDIDVVKRQYPEDAPVHFVAGFVPDVLPLDGVNEIAFIHMNTGDWDAESISLPYLYEMLSPGGIVVIDAYAIDDGHFDSYDPVLEKLGVVPLWLPTGQAVVFKPQM